MAPPSPPHPDFREPFLLLDNHMELGPIQIPRKSQLPLTTGIGRDRPCAAVSRPCVQGRIRLACPSNWLVFSIASVIDSQLRSKQGIEDPEIATPAVSKPGAFQTFSRTVGMQQTEAQLTRAYETAEAVTHIPCPGQQPLVCPSFTYVSHCEYPALRVSQDLRPTIKPSAVQLIETFGRVSDGPSGIGPGSLGVNKLDAA